MRMLSLIASFRLLLPVSLAAATFLSAHAASNTLPDTELLGGTYRSFELVAPVPDFCRKVCEKDEGCQAWTFSWPGKKGKRAKCFLKRSVTEKRKDTCCISGYKKRKPFSALRETVRNWLQRGNDSTQPETGSGNAAAKDAPTPPAQAETPAASARPATPSAPAAPARPSATSGQPAAADAAALAEKRDFCRRYAQAARRANQAARRLGCGFAGGLWGASYNGYFNWCMKSSVEAAERNTKLRSAALQRCRVARRGAVPWRRMEAPDRPSRPDYPPRWAYEAWQEGREPVPPAARRLRHRAPWLYSWLKRSGPGPRRTPWRPSLSGKCPLVQACDCPQGDSCRVYAPGEIAVYWPLGCDGPPAYLVCRVRRR